MLGTGLNVKALREINVKYFCVWLSCEEDVKYFHFKCEQGNLTNTDINTDMIYRFHYTFLMDVSPGDPGCCWLAVKCIYVLVYLSCPIWPILTFLNYFSKVFVFGHYTVGPLSCYIKLWCTSQHPLPRSHSLRHCSTTLHHYSGVHSILLCFNKS